MTALFSLCPSSGVSSAPAEAGEGWPRQAEPRGAQRGRRGLVFMLTEDERREVATHLSVGPF